MYSAPTRPHFDTPLQRLWAMPYNTLDFIILPLCCAHRVGIMIRYTVYVQVYRDCIERGIGSGRIAMEKDAGGSGKQRQKRFLEQYRTLTIPFIDNSEKLINFTTALLHL